MNTVHTLLEVGLDSYLAAFHIEGSAVQTVEISFPAQAAAIQRGTVAAAILAEPYLSQALATGAFNVVSYPYTYIAPRFLLGGWFSTRPTIARHPELMKAFSSAIGRAARWANGHRAESTAILAKYAKSPPDAMRLMARAEYAETLVISDLQAVLDVSTKYGLLSAQVLAADLLA